MRNRTLQVLLTLILLGAAGIGNAQRPGRGPGQRPAIARVYGRVLDAASHKGVEFATVSLLLERRDSVVSGALTEANGDFSMDRLTFGRYRLRIASLGYATLEQAVEITPDHIEQDLGNLRIQPTEVLLKPAEVVAEKAQTQLLVDRRVYNVDKDLSVRGGTGLDVMKNVPGLSVDADDNVQLRNSTPQIFIDGRPTALLLEQIPADEIERVEVITNPSVVFDASSSGGIINVVMKKSTRPGYTGMVQANAGTNGRFGGNANLNVKDGHFAWTVSGNLGVNDNTTRTSTGRETYFESALMSVFRQDGSTRRRRSNYGGRLGLDVQVSNRSTLSLSANARGRSYENDDRLNWTELDGGGSLLADGTQRNDGTTSSADMSAQVGFKHKTPVEGREWSTDLTYNRNRRENTTDFNTATYGSGGEALVGGRREQTSTGSTDGDQMTWQFDMTDPRGERDKLEYGLRNNTRIERSLLDVVVATDTSAAQREPALSNDYRITDIVNAAYINWTHRLNEHWGVQTGLRLEQTWFEASIRDPGDPSAVKRTFTYRYPDGTDNLGKAFFPAVYFSRKWENQREFQMNFSRKIDRPNFFQVMPFIFFSDSRNIRIGNPALAPEFINLAEVNHLLPLKENGRSNWLTSVFARYTEQVITNYAYQLPDDDRVLVNSWINGNDSWTWGWENTVKLELSRATQITFGGTVQYVEIGAGSGATTIRNNGWMADAKANFQTRLPKDWTLQVNGDYQGRRPQPQGYAIPNGGVDVSAGKDLGAHWSAQLSVNDVFYSRLWGNIIDTPVLYQETERRRDLRNVRLNVSWKFGEQDASLFRRRNQQNQRRDPGSTGGEGDF